MLKRGTKLGHYEILSLLGRGGMGEVYHARDLQLGREVAIKILLNGFTSSTVLLTRFERESKTLAALAHPSVLAIHEFSSHGGIHFAVMEFLEGETLRQRLKRSELSWLKAVAVGTAVADGLAAAHSKGIIHRDVKPENIFLTSDGRIKILDFGLARQERHAEPSRETETFEPELTNKGMILGTFGYMSPEQIRGQQADARSDIFSLGCVLYEMLTRMRPFHRDTVVDTMAATLNDDAPELLSIDSGSIEFVEPIIRRCLEKNPDERFQAAKDLGFALRMTVDKRAVRTPEPTTKLRSPTVAWLIACCILLGFIFITTFSLIRLIPSTREKKTVQALVPIQLALMPIINETGEPDKDRVSEFLSEDLINRLTIRSVDVKSIHVVSEYKDVLSNLQQLGRRLDVETLMVVRLRSLDGQLEASVSLLNVNKGTNLWGERFQVTLADLSAVAGRIARKVVDQLGVTVSSDEARKLERKLTENPEAMRLYLEGRSMFATGKRADVDQAIQLFQRAVKADHRFALPHLGLANAYYWLSSTYESPASVMPKAKAAASQAVLLDDSLGEAYSLLGFVKSVFDWDWTAAELEFQKARERCPHSANVHTYYSFFLAQHCRFDDALYEIQLIRDSDPWTPVIVGYSALPYYFAGRHDKAIKELEAALEQSPETYSLYAYLGLNYEGKSEFSRAIEAFEKVREAELNPDGLGQLGHAYALAGRQQDALRIRQELLEMRETRFVSSYNFALIHVAMGDADQAFEFLQKAADERAEWIAFLKVDPRFRSLHQDPLFIKLLDHVNLK